MDEFDFRKSVRTWFTLFCVSLLVIFTMIVAGVAAGLSHRVFEWANGSL